MAGRHLDHLMQELELLVGEKQIQETGLGQLGYGLKVGYVNATA